jgi:hypothetical protein
MRKVMLIDASGILQYKYSKDNPNHPLKAEDDLLSAFLIAINTFATELGGALQTIVLGIEKLSYRSIIFPESVSILVIADEPKTTDEVLQLKAEIIYRRLSEVITLYQNQINSDNLKMDLIMNNLDEKERNSLFNDIKDEYNAKKLVKLVKKQKTKFDKLENLMQQLLNDFPSKELLLDPLILYVDNFFIIPADLSLEHERILIERLKEKTESILGSRIVKKLFAKLD